MYMIKKGTPFKIATGLAFHRQNKEAAEKHKKPSLLKNIACRKKWN